MLPLGRVPGVGHQDCPATAGNRFRVRTDGQALSARRYAKRNSGLSTVIWESGCADRVSPVGGQELFGLGARRLVVRGVAGHWES